MANFTSETMEARRGHNNMFNMLKWYKKLSTQNATSNDHIVQYWSQHKDIFRKRKLRLFIPSRSTLQHILKEDFQCEGKLYKMKIGSPKGKEDHYK